MLGIMEELGGFTFWFFISRKMLVCLELIDFKKDYALGWLCSYWCGSLVCLVRWNILCARYDSWLILENCCKLVGSGDFY
jgi:hypothetical protein